MKFSDLLGTLGTYFKIGISGVRLKNSSGNLLIRNSGDSADAEITASKVKVSGEILELNSDAAGSGADWKVTLQRPTSGMTADLVLTLPVDDGSASQVLQTDGSGNLSWASAGSTAQCATVDTTTLAFDATSPLAMFTLPANAVIDKVQVIIDTAFDGTAPTLSIGVSGTVSKYMASTQVDLKATAGTIFEVHPGVVANGSTEALIATYASDSSAAGSARILVYYSIPA